MKVEYLDACLISTGYFMVVSRVQPLLIKCGGGGEASGDSGHTFVSLRNSIKRKVTCNYFIMTFFIIVAL